MLRLKKFFWFSDILDDLHSHLKKKSRNLQFLPKISSNFEFSDVDIWPKIVAKKFFSPILWPKKFWVIITQVSNVKKPYPPLQTRLEGGVWVLLVTYPSNHLTCWEKTKQRTLAFQKKKGFVVLSFVELFCLPQWKKSKNNQTSLEKTFFVLCKKHFCDFYNCLK